MDKKKISVEVVRKDGKTFFRFEIDENIESMYKKQNPEIRDSTAWAGMKFYFLPALTTNANYQQAMRGYKLFDDFGASLYDAERQKLNIAWLRTVGGKGEVELPNEVSFAEISTLIKNAMQFVKEYFDDYYKGFTIRGNVSVEL